MFEMVISGDGCERAKLMPSLEVLAVFGTDFVWPHTVGLESNTVGLSGSGSLSQGDHHDATQQVGLPMTRSGRRLQTRNLLTTLVQDLEFKDRCHTKPTCTKDRTLCSLASLVKDDE